MLMKILKSYCVQLDLKSVFGRVADKETVNINGKQKIRIQKYTQIFTQNKFVEGMEM